MQPLLTLVIIGIGFAVMFGAVRLRTLPLLFVLLLVGTALLPVVVPAAGALAQAGWGLGQELSLLARIFVLALLGIAVLRLLMRPILGRHAADSMAGELAANLVMLSVRVLLFPFRMARRLFRLL